MSGEATTIDDLRRDLMLAAMQASGAVTQLLEQHRDTEGETDVGRLPEATCELLAEGLGLALSVEIAACELELTRARSEGAQRNLRDSIQQMGQLRAAAAKFIEDWVG